MLATHRTHLARQTIQPHSLLSRGAPSASTAPAMANSTNLQFTRGKRTKRVATVSQGLQRVITQLSVISARKKMPRMLKLSKEDLVRHDTIQAAWSLYQKELREARDAQLEKQHQSIVEALDELEALAPELYKVSAVKEKGKRFPLDARVPVDFPPNTVWHYQVAQKEDKKTKK